MRRSRVAVFELFLVLVLSICCDAVAQAPANDAFQNAILLSNSPVDGTNARATAESGEPSALPSGAFASVWYQYQQPVEGTLWLHIGPTTAPYQLVVYRGNTLANLQQLLTTSVEPGDFGDLVLHVEAGVTYRISIDSPPPIAGAFTLHHTFYAGTPPANDLFANRTLLTSLTNSVVGSTYNASSEALDPPSYGLGRSLWYEYRVPESGRLVRRGIQANNINHLSYRGDFPLTVNNYVASGSAVKAGESIYLTVISPGSGGSPFEVLLGVDPSPVLNAASTNKAVTEGTPAILSANYIGSDSVNFQWFKEEQPVPNGTNLVLELGAMTEAQVGTYKLIATSAYGSATSPLMQLTMNLRQAGTVSGLPAQITVHEGAPVQLGPATVSGDPPPALWWERQTAWGWIALGQTNAALLLQPSHWEDAGHYRLSASNAMGSASATIELQVDVTPEPPAILAQPQNLNIPAGSPVEVPILMEGRAPCTFYWRTNGVPVAGQIMPALNPGALPTGTRLVVDGVVSNTAGIATITPFSVQLVGQSIYRQDFEADLDPNQWPTNVIRRSARHGQSEGSLLLSRLSLSLKAATGSLVVGWDGWMVDTWDGEDGQWGVDVVSEQLGGSKVLQTSFSNTDGEWAAGKVDLEYLFMQAFPGNVGEGPFDARTGALGIDVRYLVGLRTPALYRFRHLVNWNSAQIPFVLATSGLSDESLSLDNLYVSLLPSTLAWIRPATTAISVSESAGSAVVRLLREGNTNSPVTVRYAVVGYGAVAGRDFVGGQSSVTFAPGETVATISIPVLPNPTATRTKSLGVWLLDAGAEGVFSATPFVGISLRDDQSQLRLVRNIASIKEGSTAVVGQVIRSGDITVRQSVTLAVTSQSSWGPLHVTGWVGGTNVLTNFVHLYFQTGATSAIAAMPNYYPPFKAPETNALASLSMATRSDSEPELSSAFTVRIASPMDAANPEDEQFSFVIADDDLSNSLKRLTWTVDMVGNNLHFAAAVKPVRFRMTVQSSDDLLHWTTRLELDSQGRGSLPFDRAGKQQFYRTAFLPN